MESAARKEGISRATLYRARKRVATTKREGAGPGSESWWQLAAGHKSHGEAIDLTNLDTQDVRSMGPAEMYGPDSNSRAATASGPDLTEGNEWDEGLTPISHLSSARKFRRKTAR